MRASTIALLGALCACSAQRAPRVDDSLPREECRERADGLLCQDDEALTCADEQVVAQEDCAASQQQVCFPPLGCVSCLPGTYRCDGQRRLRCDPQGSEYELVETCDEGLSCSGSGCRDLCADALDKRSYIGCEYYPVFTSNEYLDERFLPAVVIANPNLAPAHVTIRGAKGFARELDVEPSGVETVMLEFLPALKAPQGSALVRGGAYHLVSSVPVTVHQFNPLLFEVDEDCLGKEEDSSSPNDDKCNSFSNDASLLLPAHVLSQPEGRGTAYFAISRPTLRIALRPQGPFRPPSAGFVAIVGAGPDPVQVQVTSSAHTRASGESSEEPVDALAPGQMASFSLGRGDVLQLLSDSPETCPESWVRNDDGEYSCPLGVEYDLTGTLIEADGPIEVIGGHNCAYVPFNRVACDHLEETMFPIETWGIEAVAPRPRTGTSSPHVVRVLSAAGDNTVRFEPASVHEPVALARGESFELTTNEHVIVRADKPIAVAQFLVGQGVESRVGDPSLSLAIPIEQYRSAYAFLSPSSYDVSYVSVIARAGDEVQLDGVTLGGFTPIGDGSFTVTTATLRKSGVHEVHSEHGQGIGLNVYGYGDYTSYMVPGGLDLRVIATVY